MNFQAEFQNLLQQRISRKEFLRRFGVLILAMVGFGSLLRYLGQDSRQLGGTSRSYGRNSFGGKGLKNINSRK